MEMGLFSRKTTFVILHERHLYSRTNFKPNRAAHRSGIDVPN